MLGNGDKLRVESCSCPAGGGVGRGGGWMYSHGVDMQQEKQMSCAAVRRQGAHSECLIRWMQGNIFTVWNDEEKSRRNLVGPTQFQSSLSSTPRTPFVPELRFPRRKRAAGPLWRMSEICVLLCRRVSGLAANRLFPQAAGLRDSLHCWRHHRLLHGGHRYQGSPVDAARQDR